MPVRLAAALFLAAALVSCAGKPPSAPPPAPPAPLPEPASYAALEKPLAKATALNRVVVGAVLVVANPASVPLRVQGIDASLESVSLPAALTLSRAESATVAPGSSAAFPVEFALELAPAKAGANVEWTLKAAARCAAADGTSAAPGASCSGAFPRVAEPSFEIRSLRIKKSELINTRFLVGLRIGNPNDFDVTFKSLSYELFGEGRFWADGTQAKAVTVGAKSEKDLEVALVMNFIDMKREILDQVIRLDQVRYRFKGGADVDAALDFLPCFHVAFDRDGATKVIE